MGSRLATMPGLPTRGFTFGPFGTPIAVVRLAALAREMACGRAHRQLRSRSSWRAPSRAHSLAGSSCAESAAPTTSTTTRRSSGLYRRFLPRMMTRGASSQGRHATPVSLASTGIDRGNPQRQGHGAVPARAVTARQASVEAPADAVLFGVTSRTQSPQRPPDSPRGAREAGPRRAPTSIWLSWARDPSRSDSSDEIDELGLANRVHWLGFRRDLPDLLSNSRRVRSAQPPESEAFPNTLVEAMASGLPCITTDVGSVREIVVDELSGLAGGARSSTILPRRLNASPPTRACASGSAWKASAGRTGLSLDAKTTEFERYPFGSPLARRGPAGPVQRHRRLRTDRRHSTAGVGSGEHDAAHLPVAARATQVRHRITGTPELDRSEGVTSQRVELGPVIDELLGQRAAQAGEEYQKQPASSSRFEMTSTYG